MRTENFMLFVDLELVIGIACRNQLRLLRCRQHTTTTYTQLQHNMQPAVSRLRRKGMSVCASKRLAAQGAGAQKPARGSGRLRVMQLPYCRLSKALYCATSSSFTRAYLICDERQHFAETPGTDN